MKRTILSLMMFGLFAGAQTAAVAQNVTADDKSGGSAQTGNTQGPDATAPKAANGAKPEQAGKDDVVVRPLSKSEIEAARAQAQTRFDAAKAKCDAMSGEALRTCVTDAKTARAEELSKALRPTQVRAEPKDPGTPAPGKDAKSAATPSTGAATAPESSDRGGLPATAAGTPDPSGPRPAAGYNAAQDMAQSRYDDAASKCNSLGADAGRACLADAAKARTEALAAAKVEWESGMQPAQPAVDPMKRSEVDRRDADG